MMGGVMASPASVDFFHDLWGMGRAMAVLAVGYGPVLLRMAQGACKMRVFAPTGAENVGSLLVAGSAVL